MKFAPYVVVIAVFGLLGCWKDTPAPSEDAATPTYRNLGSEAQYVGIDACKSCHADKYETFVHAQMGRSFKPATPAHSAADFDDARPVYDPHNDLYYQPFREGDALFLMEYRLQGRDTVHKRIERIDYIVGSGQHTNSHIMDVNGYLYQMPLTWYAQDGKWDLPPKFDGGNNYRFDRPIPLECMACHNATPSFVPGSGNRFTEVAAGIDCERCHGPGSIHVAEKQAGRIVDVTKEIDYTIVNPGKLPLDRQFDVCQRCHMQGATVFKEGQTALDFRPGMRLADVMNVFWPRYADSTKSFIMASHPDRLRMSECFIGSRDGGEATDAMTCTTCHDPHVPIEALGADHYRQVCQSCHTPEHTLTCTEAEPVRLAQGDNCVTCHMPVSGSSDIPHVRITDHFIRVPEALPEEEVEARKQFVGLASLIDPNPSAKEVADGYLTYYEEFSNRPDFLDSAEVYLQKAGVEHTRQALAPSLVRLWFFQKKHGAIVELAQTLDTGTVPDAWTWYRIGEAYYQSGRYSEAAQAYERAVDLAPAHLQFMNKLATTYTAIQRLDDALAVFDTILDAHPGFGDAYNNRGFARLMQGDLEGAEADFRAALALHPDAEQALANLASLYLNTERHDEARPLAQRLLRLQPDNPQYRQLAALLE